MAFVFRAKRNLKFSEAEPNNIYPGEYYKENRLIKDIDKQSSEFQSKTTRNLAQSKFNTPGPGSYEKDIIYYDIFGDYKKKKKSYNIYDSVKTSVIPKEVQQFITKNQAIAFNTRGGRFNYQIDELERQKNVPGPGAYSPEHPVSLNKKKNLNINKEINNKSKIIDKNICINTNNNNSSITNNISNSNRSQSTNDNSNKSRLILKKTKSFNSDYRTETIPSKGNLGYDIDLNGDKKLIMNNNENNMSGNKNDSVGPGQYNLQLNWDKNFLSWEKMRNDNDEKYNIIKARKNLSPLAQLEKDYLLNSQRQKYKIIPKTKTENNSRYNNSKSKLYNYFMNLRYDKIKKIDNKKEFNDFIFDGNPGPGYYSPEKDYSQSENYFSYNKSKKNFDSKTPRFKTVSKANNDLGPGYYYNKSKPKKVEKPRYMLGLIDNPHKDDSLCALKLSLAKENYKVPGPGSYEIERNFLHEDISNNQNFGSNDKRFKISKEIKEDYPGPGSYENKDGFNANQENKDNIKKNNIFTNYKTDLELIKELEKMPKDEFSTPPVGLYNPNIISSMEYNAKSKINPYADEKIIGFGVQEKKGMSFINKENNRNIGPGRYYKNKKIDMKQNNVPFNQSNKRFNYEQLYNNKMPGPGTYDINSFDDWNKKSHNILFV